MISALTVENLATHRKERLTPEQLAALSILARVMPLEKLARTVDANLVQVVHRNAKGELVSHEVVENLRTNAGGDFQGAQMSGTASTSNANFIALSSDVVAPATTDTTLAGEITTGGLARASGTYAHTAITGGTTTTVTGVYTLTKTFTATAIQAAVQKAGMFTANSGGTMMFENTFTAATLQVGDTLAVTWTVQY